MPSHILAQRLSPSPRPDALADIAAAGYRQSPALASLPVRPSRAEAPQARTAVPNREERAAEGERVPFVFRLSCLAGEEEGRRRRAGGYLGRVGLGKRKSKLEGDWELRIGCGRERKACICQQEQKHERGASAVAVCACRRVEERRRRVEVHALFAARNEVPVPLEGIPGPGVRARSQAETTLYGGSSRHYKRWERKWRGERG